MKITTTAIIAALSVAGLATPTVAADYQDIRHQVEVPHGERQVTAVYQPKTMVSYRQVGNMTPNRPSTARCMWKAEISVERHLQAPAGQGSHVVRTLVPTKLIEGSTNGRCAQGKEQVSSALARRTDEVRSHVLAVAAEDRNALMAELSIAQGNPAG
ncbi:MAG: hypothetical protein ACT6R2_17885 [Blastomonas fulva]|jgi:hypothetical protein|uniref:Uncharacterized protein n=1 Tax=Blastomonas fulva TaxID=1550728 RepID=A0ABM6M3R1_9SPHN|nr:MULTISPECIES: hypothetical protein [Blastomonas]AOG01593.1 hypothetical protein BSY18_2207 [Blastomonas sp. RAC04]ASR50493.1 hypothetical protein B5J99_02605 [Blastomonas fulva]MDK2756228.1 hypothetical protein [Blastomonas fulva]MDM7927473.1 hypothetical protein [Blastomonas fulva]MDM7964913.1 hypothetical protein [Blastomonas fulva]